MNNGEKKEDEDEGKNGIRKMIKTRKKIEKGGRSRSIRMRPSEIATSKVAILNLGCFFVGYNQTPTPADKKEIVFFFPNIFFIFISKKLLLYFI